MRIPDNIRFVLQSVLLGLTAAALILLIWPDLSRYGGDGMGGPDAQPAGSYSTAVNSAAPAVVNIYASKVLQPQANPLFQDPLFQRFFGLPQPAPNQHRNSNQGSGVIMNDTGYILTNAHVIQGMDEIRITLISWMKSASR